MRYLVTLLAAVLWVVPAAADDNTLLGDDITHGGFGGPVVKFTQVADEFTVLVGGRGGWIINHQLILGFGGYGMADDDVDERILPPDTSVFLSMGYAGLEIEYDLKPSNLVHLSFTTLIGAGGLNYSYRNSYHRDEDYHWGDHNDAFFIAEPGINATLNMTRFFRVSIGAGYRFVSDVELLDLDNSDISGASANVMFRFGHF